MDCSEYRTYHPDFLDGSLDEIQAVRAQRHLLECSDCSAHDARIRRALLVFRNIPEIKPSAHFSARLHERISAVREDSYSSRFEHRAGSNRVSIVGVVAFAAGVTCMAAVYQLWETPTSLPGAMATQTAPAALAPQLAATPTAEELRVAGPTILASMSAGLPVWPAVFMAEDASRQLAEVGFHFAAAPAR